MPGLPFPQSASRKRQRVEIGGLVTNKPRKAAKITGHPDDASLRISVLESELNDGNQHLNNIVELQKLVSETDGSLKNSTRAAVALCRVFCRLIASEQLTTRRQDSDEESQVIQWLKARLRDYVESLLAWIGSAQAAQENAAITLLMRIVKSETQQDQTRADQAWITGKGTFTMLAKRLLSAVDAEGGRQEFVDKYVEEHDDVRFYTFLVLSQILNNTTESEECNTHALELLARITGVPESENDLDDWFGREPPVGTHRLRSLTAHRKVAQECWLALFRRPLSEAERKKILNIMPHQLLPWFSSRLEVLTDFLTDSFNAGGALSLLALSGIFHLMTNRNLDYPDFYVKLYSLLDEDVLHSSHRNRFFRLLEKFMASTHLPAALVASFLKRIARLSLQAPPGAIVWIVPWTYNLMRSHPSCTFMLHRPDHPAHNIYKNNLNYKDEGMDDPFLPLEADPMLTNAIDSSLWELHTLQSHWHPNVATLAKILGEQFTKREYNLEDFLDHSYSGLLEAELKKELKKQPEVEWEIPKRIVSSDAHDGSFVLNNLGVVLKNAVESPDDA